MKDRTQTEPPAAEPAPRDQDATARIRAFYEGRFDDVSAAVFVISSSTGAIVTVNAEAEELTGHERVELERMTFADIFQDADRQRVTKILGSAAALEFDSLFEHHLVVHKRSRRRLLVDLGIRRAAVPGALVFTLQDITSLKTNEQRVQRAHEYVSSIINSILEVLLVTDERGRISTANPAALALLGYQADELRGEPISRVLPTLPLTPAAPSPSAASLQRETQALTRDGRDIPVLVSQALLRGAPEDSGAKTVFVVMDITERKKAERLIAEQQMMLVQSSKMSALGEMASSIAHEVNNPLQVILGRCELLELATAVTPPNLADLREGVGLIDQMSQRIHKIVRGLQALARDQRQDPKETVLAGEVVREALAVCEQRLRLAVERLELPDLETPVQLFCRPTQISQVILNLLNNSCDEVGGRPGSFIRLDLAAREDEVEISVTDSGRGIAPEVAERLFTPFFTTKPVGKGTGIGLSVSKSLIESHGGVLELDRSSPHTRFVIRLPAAGATRRAG